MSGRDRKIEKCGHSEDLKSQREAEFLESGVSGKPRGRSPGVRGGVSDPKARSVAPNGVGVVGRVKLVDAFVDLGS